MSSAARSSAPSATGSAAPSATPSAAGRTLAVVPARGGSKGLPGKNLAPVAGEPLIAHTLRFAGLVGAIDRCVVTTDDDEIARIAGAYGADVPFRRPAELSGDAVPMAPVVRHALEQVERAGDRFDTVVLLMPTTPVRRVEDLSAAIAELASAPGVDGVVSVSEPAFNPLWVGVRSDDGGNLRRYFDGGAGIVRRQDAGRFLRINGLFYVWRAEFVRRFERSWLDEGTHRGHETDDFSALDVDTADDLARLRRLLDAGMVELPGA